MQPGCPACHMAAPTTTTLLPQPLQQPPPATTTIPHIPAALAFEYYRLSKAKAELVAVFTIASIV